MSGFQYLSFQEIKTNFNALAKKELAKYKAEDDFARFTELNPERAEQLTQIDNLIDALQGIHYLDDEVKVKLVMKKMMSIKNDIRQTYSRFKPDFLVLSTVYNGIDPAIGISAANPLTDNAKREIDKAHNEYVATLELNERFKEHRETQSYTHFKTKIDPDITYNHYDSKEAILTDAFLPVRLRHVIPDVKNNTYYFADIVGFQIHLNDDPKVLNFYQHCADTKVAYQSFMDTIKPQINKFNINTLKKRAPIVTKASEEEETNKKRYNTFMFFNENVAKKIDPKNEKITSKQGLR